MNSLQRLFDAFRLRISLRSLHCFFVVFGFIYFPVFQFSGVAVSPIRFVMLFAFGIAGVKTLTERKIDSLLVTYSVFLLPYVYYVVGFKYNLGQFRDSDFRNGVIMLYLTLLSAIIIAKYICSKVEEEKLLEVIFFSTIIFSIVIVSMTLFEPLKETLYAITKVDKQFIEDEGAARIFGPNGIAGAYLSTVLLIGLLAGVFVAKNCRTGFYFGGWIMILWAMISTGRSGVILLVFLLPIALLLREVDNIKAIALKVGSATVLIVAFIVFSCNNLDMLASLHPSLSRLVSVLQPIVDNDIWSERTVEFLWNRHYFLPETWPVTFWGTGTHGRNVLETGYYIPSDVGYVRDVFAVGFFGCVLCYSFYAFIFFHSLARCRSSACAKFTVAAILAVSLFHAKELGIATVHMSFLVFLPFFARQYREQRSLEMS